MEATVAAAEAEIAIFSVLVECRESVRAFVSKREREREREERRRLRVSGV